MSFGIYIHWPFCKSKCPYCDFNSHVHDRIDYGAWRDAYLREISYWTALTGGRTVETVFFGGGTPSLMTPDMVGDILSAIQKNWRVSNNWEVTIEANPTSFEIQKFRDFYAAGVNRVSIGVQSLYADDLKFLGREHSPEQARHAIIEAQKIFPRVSFDLIYARPGQNVTTWRKELEEALQMGTGHLSLYQLIIERGTPFFTRHARGEFQIPEQDDAADLYDVTQELCDKYGLPAYEVSNHARAGEESRHNLIYWRYGDYAGIGPGAHGRYHSEDGKKWATRAHRAPDIWLNQVQENGNGTHPHEELTTNESAQEALMMGLRLKEGVPYSRVNEILGGPVERLISMERVTHLVDQSMLVSDPKVLKTTPQGFKCLNAVLGYLLAD